MPRSEGQKGKLVWLLRILARYTDEEHLINVPRILELLAAEGIAAERKSVYDDIATLRALGYDIVQHRGRGGGYYLASRPFQLPELKLLADSVQASRFITRKKSDQLIRALSQFASQWEANELQRQVFASSRVKSMNESIYYNVDALHRAIASDRQVRFVYQEWNLDKKKVARRGGGAYQVSPWALLWEEENYYLVAFEESKGMRHYRVDKMTSITTLEQPRLGREEFAPQKMRNYAKPMFGMFGGPVSRVELRCENSVIGPMLDRFGTGVTIMPQPDGWFTLYADVVVSPPFFGWLCGFGGRVELVAPADARQQLRQMLETISKAYQTKEPAQ